MKTLVAKSIIYVEGVLWQTGRGTTQYTVPPEELEKLKEPGGNITQDSVFNYLSKRWGDFSRITHFFASIEDGPDTVEISYGKPFKRNR